jgi:hypothetical protein
MPSGITTKKTVIVEKYSSFLRGVIDPKNDSRQKKNIFGHLVVRK